MTEEQKFDRVEQIAGSNVEIRKYHECVLADVVVQAEYQNAGSMGFRPLVTYISRNNIAMTAPVIQEPKSQAWVVSFVMPEGMTEKDMPIPADSKVSLRTVHEHFAAALTFSGVTTENKVKAKEAELRSALAKANIAVKGQIRIARFDPPWKPGFMRKNEVILEIER
jgi:hypothetical protein